LPYGFEIYSLLTRWNPLNTLSPVPQKKSGKKILIAGLGPAGYTLAHHLLNDGHEIVAIDGLKIEPLDAEISGIDIFGNRKKFKPIKFVSEIYEPLSSRLIYGFGGVAEYGITARWDKNFLKIIRLLLERRANFRMFGGIRFGSSITEKIAFEEYGFDHVALCIGAGRPNIIDIKNNFAKGIRSASDFLMSLQLTGAFKKELFTNLQIRMPILVLGAGLTAMDTACEAQAYYLIQIEKFADKYKKLKEIFGEEKILQELNEL
jgi:NADPH-dependent glutamate synthase beta subunit-like oxidoreductase